MENQEILAEADPGSHEPVSEVGDLSETSAKDGSPDLKAPLVDNGGEVDDAADVDDADIVSGDITGGDTAEQMENGGLEEEEDVADVDADDILGAAGDADNEGEGQGDHGEAAGESIEQEVDDSILLGEDQKQEGEEQVDEEEPGVDANNVEPSEEASVAEELDEDSNQMQDGDKNATDDVTEAEESELLGEEGEEFTEPMCNTDNNEGVNETGVDENDEDDLADQIMETVEPEEADKSEDAEEADILDDDIIPESATPTESAQQENEDSNLDQPETLESIEPENGENSISEIVEQENPDTIDKDEEEVLDLDEPLDIRQSEIEPDKGNIMGEDENSVPEPIEADSDKGGVVEDENSVPEPSEAESDKGDIMGEEENSVPEPIETESDKGEIGEDENSVPEPSEAGSDKREVVGEDENSVPEPIESESDKGVVAEDENSVPEPSETESDKREVVGEDENSVPEPSEAESASQGEASVPSENVDDEPMADIDELDIQEVSQSPKEAAADSENGVSAEDANQDDVEEMEVEEEQRGDSKQAEAADEDNEAESSPDLPKDVDITEASNDASEQMDDVSQHDLDEPVAMDTDTAKTEDISEAASAEEGGKEEEEEAVIDEDDIQQVDADQAKSPEAEQAKESDKERSAEKEDTVAVKGEAEEKDADKDGDAYTEMETTEETKGMEAGEETEKDGADQVKLKAEPGVDKTTEDSSDAKTTEPAADQSQDKAETDAKKDTPPTDDVAAVKIKKEAIEDSAQTDKAEASQDAEPVVASSENSTGLKIVGVTSAVGVDEKGDAQKHAEAKGDDSGDLSLKISSVTGAGDVEEKKEATNEKVAIKKEKIEELKAEKTEVKKDENKRFSKVAGKPEDDDVIAVKEEKKPPTKPKSSKIQKCIVCSKVGKCKYNIVRNGDVKHLCDDTCFKKFRSSPTTYLKNADPTAPSQEKPAQNSQAPTPTQKTPTPAIQKNNQASSSPQPYKTCNVCQLMNVRTSKPFLTWQGLDFCGEECLGKFQGGLSVTCSYCSSHIQQTNKAKYCWRVANEVKHFCSATCNNEFVKRMKLCAFCNKDLATVGDSFMAPVGDKGMFKDFCSQKCLQHFEEKNNKELGMENGKSSQPPKGNFMCAVCGKIGPVKHEIKHDGKTNRLCGDPCFSAFQYTHKLQLNPCFNCGTSCQSDSQTSQFIQFEGQQKRFCSFMCVNTFRNKFRKTVPCGWCGAKKNNFDMIERVDANNKYQLFCSLNCLSLYRVNLQATSNQAVVCDQCRKFVPAQYHLTMSDASVRNFCSYGCVMQFQAQFQTPKTPVSAANQASKQAQHAIPPQQQQTTTRSGRVVKGSAAATLMKEAAAKASNRGGNRANSSDSFPIISNVVSLAPKGGSQQQINIKSPAGVTVTDQQGVKTTTTTTGNQTVQQQIIIQPPPPKLVKNKSMLCKPVVQTKATSCRPHTQTKETQTDGKLEPDKYLVPVPVPIYCPTPLPMYTTPTPILIPVPVPIPIPVFIPTTKKSTASILKQIKEIQEKIPADPLEAELLMMAEAVAGKEESSSSESDDGGDTEVTPVKETPTTNPPQGGDLGEDMLQMALRMASEMSDEPVMDLETSLEPVAVSTVPPPAPPAAPKDPVVDEDDEDYVPTPGRQTRRSRGGGGSTNKRPARSTPRRGAKRQKVEVPDFHEPTPSPPQPAAPPLDANFHLKYTYGVNAFKHWVMAKNTTIEQQSKPGTKPPKTFKLDILQCVPDELNHALCLFVKEVRKPNGEMYAVDSIYYLTLGIQQYLFENGRIDNIFTDIYYERFTECLNELLTRYEPKLNQAGQLVCRIEEEHLWESKQLGAHSPYVLLNSLVYFNTKFFMLKTSEDHLKLSFTHIMKHWKKNPSGRGSGTGPNAGRSVYLRYYCPSAQGKAAETNQKKQKKEEMPVYEQTENLDNPLRCPVKLYEFYLSKCPESIKNRNDTFYLVPERSCVPDSPVWYSTAMLGIDQMAKMLNRIRLVREIQEAHLHTQPIFI